MLPRPLPASLRWTPAPTGPLHDPRHAPSLTRASARAARPQQKYKRLGSPVEKVLEILVRLKKDPLESSEDRENISFIMDIIISDQLYAVNVGNLGKEMLQFVGQQSQVDVFAQTKRKASDGRRSRRGSKVEDGLGSASSTPGAQRRASTPGGQRRTSVTQVGDESLWVDKLIAGDEIAACLEHVDRWDFDIFEFERVAGPQSLVIMVVHLLRLNGLEDSLDLNVGNLVRTLTITPTLTLTLYPNPLP